MAMTRAKTPATRQDPLHRRAATRSFAPWRVDHATDVGNQKSGVDASCESLLGDFCSGPQRIGRAPRQPATALLRCPLHQRRALRPAVVMADDNSSTSASAVVNRLCKLRELGVFASNRNTMAEMDLALFLEEVVIPAKHTVRLHDVEGRTLVVQGATAVETRPIHLYADLSAAHYGDRFYITPLLDRPTIFSSSHSWNAENSSGVSTAVPQWKHYTVAVALYIALAEAGYCDQALPFLSVQWINWQKLLRHQMYLRLELLTNSVTRELLRLHHKPSHHQDGDDKGGERKIPVALQLPLTRKGVLRRPHTDKEKLPSLYTQPFTDVEVFELFYLQLVFRALYDIRFPGMTAEEEGRTLRSDLIGVQTGGVRPLAFEHPTLLDRWLLFPPRSQVLHFVSLEEAVIPHYASSQRNLETAHQRLFGATEMLPCQGQLGRDVVINWAMQRVICSPQDAFLALEELFNLFEDPYGVERATVWQAPVLPRTYRCGMASLRRLHRNSSDLSLFFSSLHSSDLVVENHSISSAVQEPTSCVEISEDRIVQRWRQYIQVGSIALFDGNTDAIEIVRFLGMGGSSLVYEGRFGPNRLPVAVKCLIVPSHMDHETYVKESLTNVAFFVLFNQMESCGILYGTRIYEFVVSSTPPNGMPAKDVIVCSRGADADSGTKLCYVVTRLMDGVVGRFLTEEDDEYDPCYDALVNAPLRDGEIFQFLYTQLAVRALFDYTILDLMLHGQLRGDNLGYALVSRGEGATPLCPSYDGIVIVFQTSKDTSPRYLRFPVDVSNPGKNGPLRFICFIDLGQGKQPQAAELTRRGLIGETIVESCVVDDGLGRYWPLDRIYSKYIETSGTLARSAVEWGSGLCVDSPQAAEDALEGLFELYEPTYGVSAPTSEELVRHAVFVWTPSTVAELRRYYVYRDKNDR
ncbi:transferase [Trypanosoma rangeli]|uniref:Transferase n=1 Tax=Trypanosoma rangeli TaxID=5698 RepID=A0A3S5IRS9_TRYRA|nr:transferase [Trypanosoma rangeli]RNF08612.1 transferase [Trypanosoma rangeli]|eukprot:RNF08612.1 transferase [Trypanosoma rangeli]